MRLMSIVVTSGLIMAGLIGCASSHTKPRHIHAYPHVSGHERSPAHGHYHGGRHIYPRIYRRPAPPPVPGRLPDGRYVLPGGLESVCAGGTPPPCQ